MRRTEARELFMQLLFQMEMQNDYSLEIKKRFADEKMEHSDQKEYFDLMFDLTGKHLDEIDKIIENSCKGWKLTRLSKVDLAVLRLCVCEIMYCTDIPDSVSINEAVDMAKKFGGEDSGKFVNGVLGHVARGKDEKN